MTDMREAVLILAKLGLKLDRAFAYHCRGTDMLTEEQGAKLRAFAESPAEPKPAPTFASLFMPPKPKPALTVEDIAERMIEEIEADEEAVSADTYAVAICARVAFSLLAKEGER